MKNLNLKSQEAINALNQNYSVEDIKDEINKSEQIISSLKHNKPMSDQDKFEVKSHNLIIKELYKVLRTK